MGKPSTKTKRRYNKKVYSQFNVNLDKNLVALVCENLKDDGISKSEFVRNAMLDYLNTKGIQYTKILNSGKTKY